MGKGSAKLRSPQRKLHPDTKGRIMKPTSLRGIATKAASDKAHRFRNLFGLLSVMGWSAPLPQQAQSGHNER
jgi:hypothetical protein